MLLLLLFLVQTSKKNVITTEENEDLFRNPLEASLPDHTTCSSSPQISTPGTCFSEFTAAHVPVSVMSLFKVPSLQLHTLRVHTGTQ